jgi:hypothetical protein
VLLFLTGATDLYITGLDQFLNGRVIDSLGPDLAGLERSQPELLATW